MGSILKADDKKLNEYLLLSNGKFNIPYTQRPYEWSTGQVDRLFNDIIAVHEGRKEQHVLNFITIYLEDDYHNIYDGQQRTVTLLIIICAIVNKIKAMGNEEVAKEIREEFIKKVDWRSSAANNTKVIFGKESTNRFFEEYVINDQTENNYEEITDHEKHLKQNYDYAKKIINEYIEENKLSVEDLPQLIENMTEKMYVIILETPNEDIANQMFETLNNTGKKLVDFYVLKNKCVKVTSEEETSKYWDKIEANTDLLNKNNFLTQFVSIYNGKTSSQKAFSTLEENNWLSSPEKVESVLFDMEKVSKYYFELHEPEQRKRPEDTKADLKIYRKLVNGLKQFKATQYRPVILAMNLKGYSLNDINKALQVCMVIQVRNIFIAQKKANTLETFYPELAKKIYENENIILNEILNELSGKIINEEETILALKNRSFKRSENKAVRYLLKSIFDVESDKEIKVNSDSQYVNLEHILPQNPKEDSQWKRIFDESIIEKYISNIGNLTLLLGKKNSSLGNKEFSEKREQLKESSIIQNQEIAENIKWTKKEIEERADRLAEKVIKVWSK